MNEKQIVSGTLVAAAAVVGVVVVVVAIVIVAAVVVSSLMLLPSSFLLLLQLLLLMIGLSFFQALKFWARAKPNHLYIGPSSLKITLIVRSKL